jgi:hypothetical protein
MDDRNMSSVEEIERWARNSSYKSKARRHLTKQRELTKLMILEGVISLIITVPIIVLIWHWFT